MLIWVKYFKLGCISLIILLFIGGLIIGKGLVLLKNFIVFLVGLLCFFIWEWLWNSKLWNF